MNYTKIEKSIRQRVAFAADLCKLFNEIEILSGFIIGGRNLKTDIKRVKKDPQNRQGLNVCIKDTFSCNRNHKKRRALISRSIFY